MGAHPYWYYVPYQKDLNKALQELREREFKAGRYNPVTRFPKFPVDDRFRSLGAQHDSIEDAVAAAAEDGTRSILDIESVDDEPDFGMAGPLEDDALDEIFGTTEPTHDVLEDNLNCLERLDRGQCLYIIVYKENLPDEIFFGGISFD
jgi:hypothetical protein